MDQRHCAQKLRLLPPSPPEQMHHFPLLRVRFEMPEKMIQPSLFFKHLQAQVQLHMASESPAAFPLFKGLPSKTGQELQVTS